MPNRKESKPAKAERHGRRDGQPAPTKAPPHRRRFVISAKAHPKSEPKAEAPAKAEPKANSDSQAKTAYANAHPAPAGAGHVQAADLTETIKTLLHLAHEHGHVTYDDINDILPDGLSPEDLDELYSKLRNLDVEIVDHAEVERAKPAEPEEEEDTRLEVLDDPVRMYLKKTRLLSRHASSRTPTSVLMPFCCSAAMPLPETRGLGSTAPITTRAGRCAIRASTQGGVRP